MVAFQDVQDVEEWLEPLDYIAFWEAVAPYDLGLQDRDHCDGLISGGIVDGALVLRVLKMMAVSELRVALGLKHRVHEPSVAKYIMSLH